MKDIPYIAGIYGYLKQSPVLWGFTASALILLVAFVVNLIIKKFLLKVLAKLIRFTKHRSEDDIIRMISRLSNIIPAIIIMEGVTFVHDMPDELSTVVKNVGSAFIVVTFALAVSAMLDIVNTIHRYRPGTKNKSIKGYIQVIKIILSVIATILALAALVDKSPLILLSGLGAMAAVMMLLFQDTILSFVASVQISSGDVIKLGDWIEMPQLNADGDVIDIALHTVKVQNWDKTITTIPIRKLVNESFKNWRGMHESGGRRIKRPILIDQNSIHFLNAKEESHLKKFIYLEEYLSKKAKELKEWNKQMPGADPVNARRLTNIGTFRAYVEKYLRSHPKIKQDLTLIVRQLNPGPTGLPIEIYCFTDTTAWVEYEGIQSDIFDHLYAILPEFGLYAFQEPGGRDIARLQLVKK